ncbi:hypothetical protein EGW08_014335 [Elysia chlorotica]|uniref:HAT C-terminal dimerisation domain-containing protein n=1 Tax=Elysia chlorotica TaxID=188477 RepID=A0A3S1HEU1_ELYCH|nr:hypothetical protein EGW08_014335 [Elysia chlorotica]
MRHLEKASHIAATTDIWTARTTECYLTLTAHFVSDDVLCTAHCPNNDRTAIINVAEQLRCLFQYWNTHEKKADDVNQVRKKVKDIVSYFHHSLKACDRLRETQKKQGDMLIKKLIQDVDTRWNSTAAMLRRYCEQHEAVTTSLCLLGKSDMCIPDSDVDLIKAALEALGPFQLVTEEMSSEKKVTLSKMIPFVKLLHRSLSSHCAGSSVVLVLQQQLRKRFVNLENSFMASAATYGSSCLFKMGLSAYLLNSMSGPEIVVGARFIISVTCSSCACHTDFFLGGGTPSSAEESMASSLQLATIRSPFFLEYSLASRSLILS